MTSFARCRSASRFFGTVAPTRRARLLVAVSSEFCPWECSDGRLPGQVAKWQTRTVQVRVSERTWGFNSPLAHPSDLRKCPLLLTRRGFFVDKELPFRAW